MRARRRKAVSPNNPPEACCEGKQGFHTYVEGAAATKRIHRSNRRFLENDREIALYRCPYCPCWHIGSRLKPKRKLTARHV